MSIYGRIFNCLVAAFCAGAYADSGDPVMLGFAVANGLSALIPHD